MPIETNLNVSPYYDDYNEDKNFHRVLFRPGLALQARELTQLQTILQNQIERFGDNIYLKGTIIDGCALTPDYNYRYIKILDLQEDGKPVSLGSYNNQLAVQETTNLQATIINYASGYESQSPDLNTIYLKYINTGTGGEKTFSNNQVIKIYNPNRTVESITIVTGGTGYSNSDIVVILSPLNENLGATAEITTNVDGKIIDISMTNGGAGYSSIPTVFIVSSTATITSSGQLSIKGTAASFGTLPSSGNTGDAYIVAGTQLYVWNGLTWVTTAGSGGAFTAVNYIAQVRIADSTYAAPVGTAAAVSTQRGIIYQKGNFIRVDQQVAILQKYSRTVDDKVVGFYTAESIVNSNVDSTLLDLATGAPNFAAPGANRLKLTPSLIAINSASASANNDFLPLLEFQNGNLVRDRSSTQFNSVNKEAARRTFEESGNYVLEAFSLDTTAISNTTVTNTTHFNVTLSPGTAYVAGERINLLNYTKTPVRKGTDYSSAARQYINTTYGSYVVVKELLGSFDIKNGTSVSLVDTASTDVTDNPGGTPSSSGTVIGTAIIRSIEYASGTPGTPDSTYKLYIFNVVMNAGKSFKDARAVFINSTAVAVADIVLDGGIAVLYDTQHDKLVFPTGTNAVRQLTNTEFIFRSTTTGSMGTSGTSALSLASTNTWAYGVGSLSDNDVREFIYIPNSTTRFANSNAGTISATSGDANLVGVSTTFTSTYKPGDYITYGSVLRRVKYVHSDTKLEMTNTAPANVSSNAHYTTFPAYVPVDFTRGSRDITISSTTAANLSLAASTNVATNFTLYHNIKQSDPSVKTKTLNANVHVKISTDKLANTTTGPWCLGIPDVLSIEGVYVGTGNSYSTSTTNYSDEFNLINGQKDNYYGLAYLTKKPGSTISLTATSCLAVKLKAFTHGSGRYISTASYPVDDSTTPLPANKIRTESIPIYISPSTGSAISLRDSIDFRPITSNTADVSATVLASATIDPSSTETLVSGEKYFPSPSDNFLGSVESYLNRIDRIVLTPSGKMKVIEGAPANAPLPPPVYTGSMDLGLINVTPFPSLTAKQASDAYRPDLKVTITPSQTRRYTMKDINGLEKRIQRLEYYTSLNTIEIATKNLTLASEANNSIERFKNGFFVDPLNDYSISNINDGEYKALIDTDVSKLSPQQEMAAVDLKYSSTGSSNVTKNGDLVTLSYNQVLLTSQPHANKERTLVNGQWAFNGKMQVVPKVDNFFDTDVTSTSAINIDIANPINGLIDATNSALAKFNQTPNAIKTITSPTVSTGTTTTAFNYGWYGGTTTTNYYSQQLTTTLDTTTTQIVAPPEINSVQDVGTYLKSVNITPYIRAQKIGLHIGGLRPGAQHWLFFDGVDLTSTSEPATVSDPNTATINEFLPIYSKGTSPGLFADSSGKLSIIVTIPANTFTSGDKDILVMDVSSKESETSATSKSAGRFSAFAVQGTSGNITASTKTFGTGEKSLFNIQQNVDTAVLNTTTKTWSTSSDTVQWEAQPYWDGGGGTDPLAQTFYVHPQGATDNIHLTSIDIYFKAKDSARGVTLELREVSDDGNVLPYVLPFSTVYKQPGDVSVDATTAATATTFTFPSPVLVNTRREYAIVLTPDCASPDYRVWTAIPGIADVTDTTQVPNKTWGEGTMFYSTSGRSYTAVQDEDIKFSVKRAEFSSTVGTVVITNGDAEYLSIANASGSFIGGEDVAQLANNYLNANVTTSTTNTIISTSASMASLLTANSTALIVYGTANSVGTGTVKLSGVTISNNDSTNTAFISKYSNGSFIRIGNEVRQVINVGASDYTLTIDAPFNSAANGASHYSVVPKYDVVRVVSSNSTTITVNRPPAYAVNSSVTTVVASIQKAVTGKVNYYNATKGKLYLKDSNSANSTYKVFASNSSYQGFLIGDTSTATARVTSVDNLEMFSFTPLINTVIPNITSVTPSMSVTKSGSGTETFSHALNGKTNLAINDTALIKSLSNEISGATITKSLTSTLSLKNNSTGANNATSPVIDINPASLLISKYIINNSSANENTRYGNAYCKYISKRLVLAEGMDAEDIKVYISAYKPQNAEILVYAKILNSTDTDNFDDKDWSLLDQVTPSSVYSSTLDENDYREFEFTFKYSPPSSQITGVATANTGSANIDGLSTTFNTELTTNSVVKVVRTSSTTDYFISPVSSISNNTQIILESPVTFSSTSTGTAVTGLTIELVTTPKAAFKYNQNTNIVKYYTNSQQEMNGYKYMAIKAVLLSSSNYIIPKIDDIRAIAVSV